MKTLTRRQLVQRRLLATGELEFAGLAEELGVSEMTIRRDVEALEQEGVARRVRGGAISVAGRGVEPPYEDRSGEAHQAKAALAARVVDLLTPGETVILDSGSTVLEVARALRGRDLGLTVVTPSVLAALELAAEPRTRVLVTGGTLRPGELSLIGPAAETSFHELNCDTLVLGVAGVDAECGLTEYHLEESQVKRAAVRSARRIIAAVDARKLGRVHLVSVVPLRQVDVIVTDAAEGHPALDAARALGVEIVTADPPPARALPAPG